MIVYLNDDDEYKNSVQNNTFSIREKNVQAITSSSSALLPKKLSTSGTRLSIENRKFLKQLGFKLKHVKNKK